MSNFTLEQVIGKKVKDKDGQTYFIISAFLDGLLAIDIVYGLNYKINLSDIIEIIEEIKEKDFSKCDKDNLITKSEHMGSPYNGNTTVRQESPLAEFIAKELEKENKLINGKPKENKLDAFLDRYCKYSSIDGRITFLKEELRHDLKELLINLINKSI